MIEREQPPQHECYEIAVLVLFKLAQPYLKQ